MSFQAGMSASDRKSLTVTVGALLLGTLVASVLYGYTCYLTCRYYRQYAGDRTSFKALVGALWILDTLHTGFSMHFCYYYLVLHYFDPAALDFAVWSLQLSILVATAPPLLSNCFYLSRLYKISQKNLPLIFIIGSFVLARLGLELTASVQSFIHPRFSDYARFSFLVKSFCTVSSVADISLAVFITWNLHKMRTGYKRTDSTIDVLVVYTLSSGFLTSLVCFLSMMSVFLLSHGLVDLALHAILGKLYVNSVLAVLNSRRPHDKVDDSIYELSAFGLEDASEKRLAHQTFGLRSRIGSKSVGGVSTLVNEEYPPIDISVMRVRETRIEESGEKKAPNQVFDSHIEAL